MAYPAGHPKNMAMLNKFKGAACCKGDRVWGAETFDPCTFVDAHGKQFAVYCCGACRQPLPLPQLPASSTSPVTLTAEMCAAIEVKRQAALARKRAREEATMPSEVRVSPRKVDVSCDG